MDSTCLSKEPLFIDVNVMREFVVHHLAHNVASLADQPFIDYDSNLMRIGVRQFTWHNLIDMLQTDLFLKSHTVEQNKLMIEYFYIKYTKNLAAVGMDIAIEQIPFLMDQNNRLQFIEEIYFPGDTVGESGTTDSDASFLHIKLVDWLNEYQQRQIKQWLQQLGVVERTDLSFLLKTIIPNATTYITPENAIKIVKKLFILFERNFIGKEELNQLKQMKLFTTRGTLFPACECYLSDQFKPQFPLEEYLHKREDQFLSTDYLKNDSPLGQPTNDISEWKRFFLLMGVREEIYTLSFNQKIILQQATQYGFHEEYLLRCSPNGRRMADGYSGLKTMAFLRHTKGSLRMKIMKEASRSFSQTLVALLKENARQPSF